MSPSAPDSQRSHSQRSQRGTKKKKAKSSKPKASKSDPIPEEAAVLDAAEPDNVEGATDAPEGVPGAELAAAPVAPAAAVEAAPEASTAAVAAAPAASTAAVDELEVLDSHKGVAVSPSPVGIDVEPRATPPTIARCYAPARYP